MKNLNAVVDEGSRFEGNLTFSGIARISGSVIGSIYSNDMIIISDTAVVNADISAKIIIIHGIVKGDIRASSRVEIKAPARFEGTITSPSLKVESGVIFHGITKMKEQN